MTKNTKIAVIIGVVVVLAIGYFAFAHNQNNYSTPTTPITTDFKPYTMVDVAAHSTQASCWTAIAGNVYDVTTWINQHPGGPEAILSLCGKDGSAAFNQQHGGQARPANELASFKIGTLAQ